MPSFAPAVADRYHPTWRRPIAGALRRTARYAVRFCVAHRIHPDTVSYSSIVASGLAGICLWRSGEWPWLLFVAPLVCYVRLWLNMLDGMVALAANQASPRGEILNELPDRVSDVLIFVGVAHSGLAAPLSGYWVAIAALMTAYVGTLGQAVGVQRDFSGVMSKPWRMVALHAGAWLAFATASIADQPAAAARLTILDATCLVIIVGCTQTIIVRLHRILDALRTKTAGASR